MAATTSDFRRLPRQLRRLALLDVVHAEVGAADEPQWAGVLPYLGQCLDGMDVGFGVAAVEHEVPVAAPDDQLDLVAAVVGELGGLDDVAVYSQRPVAHFTAPAIVRRCAKVMYGLYEPGQGESSLRNASAGSHPMA